MRSACARRGSRRRCCSSRPPHARSPTAARSRCAASARGADGVSLEAKPAGGAWADAGPLPVGPDGTFALVVKPQSATQYRLAWGDARACLAKVGVAARVSAVVTPQGVQGTLRPVAVGAPVQLQQRQDDGTWTALDTATADTSSAWSFTRQLAAGTYRVRAAPGHGLTAGLVGAVHRPVRRLALLVALAALAAPAVAAAFANTEPYAAKEWYLDHDEAWSFWPTMPSLEPVKVAIIDSGIDGPPRSHRARRRSEVVRRRLALPRRARTRHVRRGRDRRQPDERDRYGRPRVQRPPDRRESRRRRRRGLASRRGGRDPLGRRPGRPRDQSQPRRCARPAQPVARHVLAARARRRRVRVLEGRRRGRRSRERHRSRRRHRGGTRHTPRRSRM